MTGGEEEEGISCLLLQTARLQARAQKNVEGVAPLDPHRHLPSPSPQPLTTATDSLINDNGDNAIKASFGGQHTDGM